jgi:DNA polymerase elongation subunit (family B)
MIGFYTSVVKNANTILYRGYDNQGKRIKERVKYKPTLYTESKNANSIWKSLDGTPVEGVPFANMRDAESFLKTYKDVPGYTIHGSDRFVSSFIQSRFPGKIEFEPHNVDIAYVDIETAYENGFPHPNIADQEILTIAFKSSRESIYRVWSFGKSYDPSVTTTGLKIEYYEYRNEIEMLQAFLSWWEDEDHIPDVISGWNTRFFDIPYIVNRIKRVLGEKEANRLSPWKNVYGKEVEMMGRKQQVFDIKGIESLDYLDIFKKFGYKYGNQESYKLDHIANVVLGTKKVDYTDLGSLKKLYEQDFQRFVDYNIVDVELIEKMEDKVGLLNLVLTMAYLGGVNYSDTLGTVGIWDSIIFRRLAQKKIAVPPSKKHSPDGIHWRLCQGTSCWSS